jgi:sulfite exporter TauE/SafE/plastocyanin
MNVGIIFLTGLTTGGLSCLAMQGGLLASVIANQKEQEQLELTALKRQPGQRPSQMLKTLGKNATVGSFDQLDWMPVGLFLLSKLVAHTLLGFLLGWLGSAISLSLGVRLFFQIVTALFMLATALNLLEVHPIFRYLVFQPPRFLSRLVRNSTKSRALFAPALLGLLTIFVPCGVTQAMEVVAINSGSPWTGAVTMAAFVLGTSPLFAVLGVATAKLSEGWNKRFTVVAAVLLLAMAAYSFNGVLQVLDSPLSLTKLTQPVRGFFSAERFSAPNPLPEVNGEQQVVINILNRGYQPSYVKVKAGVPVKLTLQSNGVYSCALAFVLKEFNINTFLESTDRKTFSFTPQKPGKYTYTCSMGMYSGTLEVIGG